MVTATHRTSGPEGKPIDGLQFRFISVQDPDDAKDQIKRRLARSHAVKQALGRKRKLQQESRDNFVAMTCKENTNRLASKTRRTRPLTPSLFSLAAGVLDPFQTLAVSSSRLQVLLSNYKARRAPEPVFSFAEELAFQSFRSVFRTGLVDPAVLNAVMLSLAFAVNGESLNGECLGYRGQAIRHIRQKMNSMGEATSESTIGAILLLAGIEARLGMTSQVQLHMGAVQHLLKTCQTEGIRLTSGIKRAVFWQDLNSSILAGSTRIVNHTTFAELHWTRDRLPPTFFRLPIGFERRSSLLTTEFVEVLEDLQALQYIRDVPRFIDDNVMLMSGVNDHIASIQSRLADLPDQSPVLGCCHLAAYLCSEMLCCKVWCELVIPAHVSSQLLYKLRQTIDDPIWDDHHDLLLWLIYIGGAFSPSEAVRSGYVFLLQTNNATGFRDSYTSWPRLLESLKQFIWSDKAFTSPVRALWEEACS
ncbi:hypothetical protein BR93DRAFT_924295 [Coniochaeta sp. PMI_546]|nr:hypothetical protein BR93DRAFT_924295 [Coniochaeta sp. PMI_546]